jgi:hypothetical protein
MVLLLVAMTCVFQVSYAQGATAGPAASTNTASIPANVQGDIAIDGQRFVTTVPSYAVLGENYTVRVVIQSNVGIVVPVIVQLSTPVDAIFVHPRVVQMDVQPDSSAVASFTILPFGKPHTGPFNVTAQLYVFFPDSMSSPQLVDQATATVSSIGPNPFPYLWIVLVSAGAVTLILVEVFYPSVFRKGLAAFSR